MKSNGVRGAVVGLSIAVWLASGAWLAAKEPAQKTAADLLPESTIAYIEIPKPAEWIALLIDHPLRSKLEATPDYQKALQGKEYKAFRIALEMAEETLGTKWRPGLESLLEGGIYVGHDRTTKKGVVLIRSRDVELRNRLRDVLFNLARTANPNAIQDRKYRELQGYRLDKLIMAEVGPWLVLTDAPELAKEVADNYLDADRKSLAGKEHFQKAYGAKNSKSAWAWVDLEAARSEGLGRKLTQEKSDNPVGELLLGGAVPALGKASFATAGMSLDSESARLEFTIPFEAGWVTGPRKFFFRPASESPPMVLTPQRTIFSLATYRDLAGWWLAKEDLYKEEVVAEMAKAETGIATLFGGRDFGQDVLGALKPQWQFVVARQDFNSPKRLTPAIKLPAFAFVSKLKDPAKSQRQMKITFQSVVGFLNVIGGMNGAPQLELSDKTIGKAKLATTSYGAEDAERVKNDIFYNFSPSIVVIDDWFIVCSASPLAEELAEQLNAGKATQLAGSDFETKLHVGVLGDILADNKSQLIAQNMLEKGHDRAAADREISLLLKIVEALRDVRVSFGAESDRLKLEAELRVKGKE